MFDLRITSAPLSLSILSEPVISISPSREITPALPVHKPVPLNCEPSPKYVPKDAVEVQLELTSPEAVISAKLTLLPITAKLDRF